MEENHANVPQPGEQAGGISFSGGANNEFITQFAAEPQYDRTLEEIELDEKSPAQSIVDEATRERFRVQARRRREELFGPASAEERPGVRLKAQQAESGWMIGGKVSYVDPLEEETPSAPAAPASAPPAPQPQGEVPAKAAGGFVQPLAEEDYAGDYADPAPGAIPVSFLDRFLSTNKGFSVYSLIMGCVYILWNVLYAAGLILRTMEFDAAERMLLMQGQRNYTLIFDWPMLPVLKVIMYVLPVLALLWAILFKRADNKKDYYNKKTIIVLLCLIALAMVFTVIDFTALHLLV